MVVDVPIWASAQGHQPQKHPDGRRAHENEEVRDTQGVPRPPVVASHYNHSDDTCDALGERSGLVVQTVEVFAIASQEPVI